METKHDPIEDILVTTTAGILKMMDFDARVELLKNDLEGSTLHVVSIQSENDLGMLIGKNGQNIKAMEHILRLLTFKKLPEDASFVLDVNDYRKSRASYIVEQAKTVSERVRETKRAEALFPMSSYERRLVHMELASCADIVTESVGEEPNRRVVIRSL